MYIIPIQEGFLETDVKIDYKDNSNEMLKHRDNYLNAIKELLEELADLPNSEEIFKKYNLMFIRNNNKLRIGIDFPKNRIESRYK